MQKHDFVQNRINAVKLFKCYLFSFTKAHKKMTNGYMDAEPFKIWPLWWKRVVCSTVLPACLDLHSKSPLPDIMRPCLFYTDRWKSPLGIILCFKRLMLYTGHILWTSRAVQCIWQNRRKNAFHDAALRKTLKLSRHPKELSLGHTDTEISSSEKKKLFKSFI